MNHKLPRNDYYNEDYSLNPQEEKEFQLSVKDPYYKIRSRVYLLDLDIFGKKEFLQQQVELFLFNTPEKHLPSKSDCRKIFVLDLFEKRFCISDSYSVGLILNPSIPIYSSFPEIKQMRKDLSYNEIYCSLGKLSDTQMLFINMFKDKPENNLINGLIYCPFTPDDIENAENEIIIALTNELSLKSNYICTDKDKIKILRQKLLDLYYLCDDNVDLHGITDCHSKFSLCSNISSFYCENHMCKKCCESAPSKKFCPIHDELVNFYRVKMSELFEFEQHLKNFDKTKTIRLTLRKRITKLELKTMFEEEGYKIDWENLEIKFKESVGKIQYVYLPCTSNEEAKRLYEDRSKIIKKFEKFDISIQSLMEDFSNIISRVSNVYTSCLLVVPISNIVKNYKKIPQKSERNKKFSELIEKVLGIDSSQYTLSNCNNMLGSEFLSYDYFVITFQSKEMVEKLYNLQPFYDAVIVHKLTHLKFFPHLRNKSISWRNLCLNCMNEKNPECFYDLCKNCCVKQSNFIKTLIEKKTLTPCPCSRGMVLPEGEGKCPICKQNNISDICFNKLCEDCCKIQIMPEKSCYYHSIKNKSVFLDFMNSFKTNPDNFIKYYEGRKSVIKMKIMNYLRNGDFTWFRPINDTNVTRLMLDMNKELMIIMDNPNYKREGPLKINDKMYKVFTYQNEKEKLKKFDNYYAEEGFDEKGDFYIEYDFTMGKAHKATPKVYLEVNSDKLESMDSKTHEKDFNNSEDGNSGIIPFHICLYVLDNEKYTTYELTEEIYHELKSHFSRVIKEDIQILDEVSIMNMLIGKNGEFFTQFDKCEEFGRFALIKLKNEKDALKLLLEKNRISLPLVNGKKGSPLMIVGDLLKKYIDEN